MCESTCIEMALDRIEEGTAVLIGREAGRWLIPAALLPEGTVEGDVLMVSLTRDEELTASRRRRIEELQDRLLEGSGNGS